MSSGAIPKYLDRLDAGQRQAAETERNVVVTAGAGAGKTTVLAARYAHLVIGQRIPVSEILVLTFTRKAAAEMYERIYRKLADSESPWAKEQLKNFTQARISTLDSFCADIVRQGACEYGYSPDFGIDDDKCSDIATSIAQRYLLRNIAHPGIAKMLESYQLGALATTFFGQIGKIHVTPLCLKEKIFSPMAARLEALFSREFRKRKDNLTALCKDICSFSSNPVDRRADSLAAVAASQNFLSAEDRTVMSLLPALKTLAALQMKSYGRSADETAIKQLAKNAREISETLIDFAEYERLAPLHGQLLTLLDGFSREVAEAKRMADIMDFKDLCSCAVRLLTIRDDLRRKWKSSIRRIMIDEFQDDNSLQRDLLYLLAEKSDAHAAGIPGPEDLEEGKLFFVGDEKQSIYGFRGADVSVFKSLAHDLRPMNQEGKTADISLTTNYRSSAALIDFFNDLFPRIMTKSADGSPAFEAEYLPMHPGPRADACRDFMSRIELTLIGREESNESDGDGSGLLDIDDAIAFEVARSISEMKGRLALRDRSAEYADFAVLFRTKTHQHRLERFLRLLDIPFESESPKGVFRESPASDIYCILALEENPNDKAAFAAVLRSPLCRIGDKAFVEILAIEDDFWENAGRLSLAPQDVEGIERGRIFMDRLRKAAGCRPVSDLVSIIWHEAGLAAELESRPESQPFLEHYDFIFHMAAGVDARGGGIVEMLDILRPLLNLEEDDIELDHVPRHTTGGVRLLTIHKAKGLQFPIVMLPWVENQGSFRRSQPLWQMLPEGLAIDLKPYDNPGAMSKNIFFDIARETEAAKARAELKRLFYVACTRAEDHLFFFGKSSNRQDVSGSSFLGFLDPDKMLTRSINRASLKEALRLFVKTEITLAFRSSPELAEDVPAMPGRITTTSVNEYAHEAGFPGLPSASIKVIHHPAPPPLFDGVISIAPAIFGTLCHDIVEYAIKNGSAEGYPIELLPGNGKEGSAIDMAVSYAKGFLDSPFWKTWRLHSAIQTEKPFLYPLGNHVIDGRMDLFIESDNEIFIIDFKSDAMLDAQRYAFQLQVYRNAVAGFRPGKKISTGLYDLRRGDLLWCETAIADQMLENVATAAINDPGRQLDTEYSDSI